ncbi:DNA endonuclease SmrA [Aliiglaciecola sp. CAU 1673]|uniref:DNA endonuclease SmrA n=1 Tax=Aliiglaciecola sp. CAU 1673 TaxID=3032595 RepID=UPI0023DA819B|nr:DNA endonuclease SmrA [Aliiglaciecola sp. CAU 1673]MDF2178963.1 DNA endonuclease SmrA [Aliiglaciecola sp. CAU 1673]
MSDREDTESLFLEAMQDVRPLKQDEKVVLQGDFAPTLAQQLKRQALERHLLEDGNYLSIEKVDPVDPEDFLVFKKDGVQEGVFKKLRLGQYQIDEVLHLQAMGPEMARNQLFDTIVSAYKRGLRVLLIQHGIGKHSKPFPALIKSYVNQWLRQIPEILAFHTAQKYHGGLGATYVLLRKNPQQKLANREMHRKR